MAGKGLQEIPLRIPDQWSAAWFQKFCREVLALADIRNAVEGVGVTITGNSSQPATVAASADIAGLLNVPFVTLALSSQLTAERVLTADDGIELIDDGPGSTLKIRVNNIPAGSFGDIAPLSVLGNDMESAAPPGAITSASVGDVLWLQDVGSGTLQLQFAYLRFLDGDATAPGIAFMDEPGTGVFRGAGGEFGIAVGGAEWVLIDADGAIALDADYGTEGQVMTTHGAGTAATWEDSGGSGSSSLVYVNPTIPAGNTVANTTSETAFASTYDIPADTFAAGSLLRIRAFGTYSTDAVVPPTLRLKIKLDTTVIADSTAFTTLVSASNFGWSAELQGVLQVDGVSGSLDAQGEMSFATAITTAILPHTPNTSLITVDTTQDLTISITAQWGTADTDDTITLRQLAVWIEPSPTAIDFTVALLHFDGADTSTTFTDVLGHTWTGSGDAQLDTSQQIAGTASLLLDSSGDQVDSTSADYAFGTADFTIECWVRFDTRSGNNFVFTWNSSAWGVYTFSSQWAVFDTSSNLISGGTAADDTWYHVALCRAGTSMRLFIDGTQVGSTASNSTNFTGQQIRLGPSVAGMDGWIDEFRVTRKALYIANFTPPTPPFPDP